MRSLEPSLRNSMARALNRLAKIKTNMAMMKIFVSMVVRSKVLRSIMQLNRI